MFGLFSDKRVKLEKMYQRQLKEPYELSHSIRKLSDLKAAEAESVKQRINQLKYGKR